MSGRSDEAHLRDSVRYLSQSLGALLRGATGDARAMLDLADEEIDKIRVVGERRVPPAAPDEPELPPAFQEPDEG